LELWARGGLPRVLSLREVLSKKRLRHVRVTLKIFGPDSGPENLSVYLARGPL
jgi:hypothetical protein